MSGVVLYHVDSGVAFITLNRPSKFNAIDTHMPAELANCVAQAEADDAVRVICLRGNGGAFCSGYDLQLFAETPGTNAGYQGDLWDPLIDYKMMRRNTDNFMSLFRCLKPSVAVVHGAGAIAGGSDIALCCDLILMSTSARIGYPPARVWGTPTTALWVFRLGWQGAKRMLLTGDLIDGAEAARRGLVYRAVPESQLQTETQALLDRLRTVPANQLAMQKLVLNQALHNQGLESQQILSTIFDGISRHTPEGAQFKQNAETLGWKQAVALRDQGKLKSKL